MGGRKSKPEENIIPKQNKILECSGNIKCWRHEEETCKKPGGDKFCCDCCVYQKYNINNMNQEQVQPQEIIFSKEKDGEKSSGFTFKVIDPNTKEEKNIFLTFLDKARKKFRAYIIDPAIHRIEKFSQGLKIESKDGGFNNLKTFLSDVSSFIDNHGQDLWNCVKYFATLLNIVDEKSLHAIMSFPQILCTLVQNYGDDIVKAAAQYASSVNEFGLGQKLSSDEWLKVFSISLEVGGVVGAIIGLGTGVAVGFATGGPVGSVICGVTGAVAGGIIGTLVLGVILTLGQMLINTLTLKIKVIE